MATGRAPSTPKGEVQYKLSFGNTTPFGVKTTAITQPVKSGIPYGNFYNGTLDPLREGYRSSCYLGVAYMSPADCDKYLMPGWTQTSELMANLNGGLPSKVATEATKDYVFDTELVAETVKKLYILHCLHFVSPGSRISVPDVGYSMQSRPGQHDPMYQKYKDNFGVIPGFDGSYEEAIAEIGFDQMVLVTPSQMSDRQKIFEIDEAARSQKKIWRLNLNALQSQWSSIAYLGLDLYDESHKNPSEWMLPPPPTLFSLMVKVSDLNLRDKPSSSSKSLGKLGKGEVLYQIHDQKDGWVEVCSKKLGYGYVSSDPKYIETLLPEQEAAATGKVPSGSVPAGEVPSTSDYTTETGGVPELPKPDKDNLLPPEEEDPAEEPMSTGAKVAIAGGVVAIVAAAAFAILKKRGSENA